jgi:hypothetical protein
VDGDTDTHRFSPWESWFSTVILPAADDGPSSAKVI